MERLLQVQGEFCRPKHQWAWQLAPSTSTVALQSCPFPAFLGKLNVARRHFDALHCFKQEPTSENEKIELLEKNGWEWAQTEDELAAYVALLVSVILVPLLPRFEWSASLYFLFLAVWTIYVGSHRSLLRKPTQKISLKQGIVAPVVCSASLFGIYCILRFFPDFDLGPLVSAYLCTVGALAVASNLVEPFRLVLPSSEIVWQVELPKWAVQDDGKAVQMTLTYAEVLASLVGIGVALASKLSGLGFTFNNLMAVCIVTDLLQLLSLGSFATAAALLTGLLAYDVFWVFGSSHIFGDNVMVTVATSAAFDGPMKLVFPQIKVGSSNPYAVLGLGDIAAPGLLIALMLRFDRSRVNNQKDQEVSRNTLPTDKPYFIACTSAYIFGLVLTVVANTVSGAAQPALLYLVPSTLSSVLLMARFKSESSDLLKYKDEMEDPVES